MLCKYHLTHFSDMGLDLQNDVPFFEPGGDFDLGLGDDPFLDDGAAPQSLEQGQTTTKKRKVSSVPIHFAVRVEI